MNVTLGSILSWFAIAGAHYQVQVKDGQNAVLVPAYDTGTVNQAPVSALLNGLLGTSFKLSVRSLNPDGSLPSAWSPDLSVTLVGFAVPTGLTIS